MSIQDTEQVIMNITMDMAEDPEGVYNDVMELIREEAIEKKLNMMVIIVLNGKKKLKM